VVGISHQLAGLKHLESLQLNETNIAKAVLIKLKQLPIVKSLYSWQTLAEQENKLPRRQGYKTLTTF
jgi:hypothetical protein